MLVPPSLAPGDTVRVIAPSGPCDRTLLFRGLGVISKRYRVQFRRDVFARKGFLAGSDARRLAELNEALTDPSVRAVVAARGGYGLTRIAHRACWRALRDQPKWVVGFSDITALHVEAARMGVATLHARNAAGLGRGDALAHARWQRALEEPAARRIWHGLDVWYPGRACGPLTGGNLTVLFTCFAARRLELPSGAVLAIEDVGEAPYRIDRMLSALLVGGALDRVGAVVVGEMTECAPGPHGITAAEVLRERLAALRVPVLAGLPIGHGRDNDPVHFGFRAEVDASNATLSLAP